MHLSAVLEKGLAKKEDDITNVASTAAKKKIIIQCTKLSIVLGKNKIFYECSRIAQWKE